MVVRKRTAIEALSIRQICVASNVSVMWVNSDRQLADILTKQGVLTENLDRALKTKKWRIVFDSSCTSAKNLRKQKRDGHFKKVMDPTCQTFLADLSKEEISQILSFLNRQRPNRIKSGVHAAASVAVAAK